MDKRSEKYQDGEDWNALTDQRSGAGDDVCETHPAFRLAEVHPKELAVEGDQGGSIVQTEVPGQVEQLQGAGRQRPGDGPIQAENNWERAKKLTPQGYISALDRDRAKSGVGTARASVAQAEAGVAEAQLRLSRTTINAPFSGKISRPYHAVGDLVGPLAIEPLFQLVQLDPIYARANIELSNYNDFVALRSKLTEEGIEVPDLEVFVELAGGQDYPYPGEFKGWSQSARGSQGTISGRVLYPNPEGLLLPGQNITIRGEAANKVERLVVPQRAVQQDQQGHFLKIIDQDNVVQRRNVQVGVRDGTDWSIAPGSSELAEGDRVIAEGGSAYKEGTTVEIVTQP